MGNHSVILGSLALLLALDVSSPLAAQDDSLAGAPSKPQAGNKILMMHYMSWYETPAVRGQWGRHWTGHQSEHDPEQSGEDGLPDIWSHFHPLIGLYDSADPDALECHLLQMKLAGIDGVIVDWYGIGNTDDYPSIHKAARALFDAAGRFNMTFAVCYEDRAVDLLVQRGKLQPDQVTDHLIETLRWMQAEWFTNPEYLQVDGRPLLLDFGPMHVQDPAVWTDAFDVLPVRPAFFGLHHLWKQAGADGGFTWVHHDPWEGTPTQERILERIGEVFTYFSNDPDEVIVSAYPGFKDVYEDPHPVLDHRGGKTLRETLAVAMAGPWPLIQLVTWNDYGEGTMIEPTHEFGYTFLEIIQQARRDERGDTFPYTAGDLRLPARLYALRKRDDVPSAAADRIARLLRDGACRDAREELDAQASNPGTDDSGGPLGERGPNVQLGTGVRPPPPPIVEGDVRRPSNAPESDRRTRTPMYNSGQAFAHCFRSWRVMFDVHRLPGGRTSSFAASPSGAPESDRRTGTPMYNSGQAFATASDLACWTNKVGRASSRAALLRNGDCPISNIQCAFRCATTVRHWNSALEVRRISTAC